MTSVLNTYFNEVDFEDTIYEHFKHTFIFKIQLPVKSEDFKFKCMSVFLWLMHRQRE